MIINRQKNIGMKNLLYSLTALSCLISCEVIETHGYIFAAPEPCHVESILAFANIDNGSTLGYNNVPENVEAELVISIFTFDSILGWTGDESEFYFNFASAGTYCKESIPEVEQYIHNFAKGRYGDIEPISCEATTRIACYYFPYRLEGVTAFTITANQPFNGVEAGKDISGCFAIKEFTPKLVFSYDDYSVYSSEPDKNVTITEWLALKPLATPCMHLCLHDDIQPMVDGIVFTVTMTLTDGKMLTSTTRAINVID